MLIKDAIRKDIADILTESPRVKCSSIWESKNFNYSTEHMPAVIVDTFRERWDDHGIAGKIYDATVSVSIMIVAPINANGAKEATENIAKQILAELFELTDWRSQFAGNLDVDISDDLDDDGEYDFITTTISFDVTKGMEMEDLYTQSITEIGIDAAPIEVYQMRQETGDAEAPTFTIELTQKE